MAKWIMVENHVGKKDLLVKAGIPIVEIEIAKPKKIKGLAFPLEEKMKVFQILDIRGLGHEEVLTDKENVFLLERIKTKRVVRVGNGFEYWEEIEPVLGRYAEDLDLKIEVENPHGNVSEPKTEVGKLFLRFWSVPKNTGTKRFTKAFGYTLDEGQPDGYNPSREGTPIKDDGKQIIAEVIGSTLYVLFDLPHGRNAGNIMEKIMSEFAKIYLKITPEKIAQMEKEEKAKKLLENREQYVRECLKRLNVSQVQTDKIILEAETGLAEASKRITDLTRKLDEAKFQKNQLQEAVKNRESKFREEFDKLLLVPHVVNVEVVAGKVSVFTDTVFLDYDGKKWEIGDFRIDIYENGKLRIVNLRVFDLTGQTHFNHPHVFEKDGSNVCLGNIREGVFALIGKYEYSVAAQVLIEFLHSVTKKDEYIGYLTKNWKPTKGGR